MGQKIGWAVLDTGIAAGHPHFYQKGKRDVVVAQWDCTVRGKPKKLLRADGVAFSKLDRNGHGTHVAGVIAGQCSAPLPGADGKEKVEFTGIAPQAQLYGFKVLDDDGNGRDSWIIKAVQQVADLNDQAGELVIHGMNLSLGGYFDAESYGCGFTPLCNELRRLWRQGVVVVLAAGNEGLAWLVQNDGESYPMNMDMTIGDPGQPGGCDRGRLGAQGQSAQLRGFVFLVARPDCRWPAQARRGRARREDHFRALRFQGLRPDDLDGGNERHQHGRAACVRAGRGIPVGAPGIHRLAGPGQADPARSLHRYRP